MSEAVPGGWHWRVSCFLNGCAGGSFSEPACSRAWRNDWRLFIEAMAVVWHAWMHPARLPMLRRAKPKRYHIVDRLFVPRIGAIAQPAEQTVGSAGNVARQAP